jgi:hypothetical protein
MKWNNDEWDQLVPSHKVYCVVYQFLAFLWEFWLDHLHIDQTESAKFKRMKETYKYNSITYVNVPDT